MLSLAHGTVDLDSGEAVLGGTPIRLSPQERAVLRHLAERPGQGVSRDELLVEALGFPPSAVSRAVDTVMARLRRKIEPDPARPVHLVSVYGTGYRFEPAPAVEVEPERIGLPAERTPFVGREATVRALVEAVGEHPLVTVTGPAGAGKTRLALEVAKVARFDRIVFVPLRAAASAPEAVGRIGAALGVPAEDLRNPARAVTAIARRLGAARTLLVLDNADRLEEDFGAALEALGLPGRPSRVLVTSRRPTGATIEHVVRLASLSAADALALWRDRAEAAGAPPEHADDPDLPALLAELDHLPLAVELAAARARALRPGAVLRRLDERLRLLSGGPRDGAASLSAALDWSWDLLPPDQREVLARCSAFVAPFPDGAAAAVAGPGAPEALVALERASLCSRGPAGTELLRSVQAWAADKAEVLGLADDAALRHGRWVVAALPEPIRTFEDIARVGAVLPELLAVAGRLERLDPPAAVAAAVAPWEWYQLHGPLEPWFPALDAAERAACASGDPRLVRVIRARAIALRLRGESARALAEVERALAVAPPDQRGVTLSDRGLCLADLGRFAEAEEALLAAMAALPEGPDRVHAEASYAAQRTMQDAFDDDLDARFRRCLDAADRGVVTDRIAAGIRANYGVWLSQADRLAEADEVLTAAIATLRAVGAERRAASTRMNRGGVRFRLGRRAEGLADAEEGLEVLRREGHLRMVTWGVANLSTLRVAVGDPTDALLLLDEAEELALAVRDRNADRVIACYRAVALARLGRLDEADECLARARAHGAASGATDGLLRVAAGHVDAARTGDPEAAERVRALLADPPRGSGATFLLELLRG